MNKKGYNFVGLIFAYWWQILVVILIIAGHNFAQNYFNPEYCLTDTSENRATVEAYGFKISDSQKSDNKFCFRSNNQALVQSMYENIEDKRLQKEFEIQKIKEENRNQIIRTLLEPQYLYFLLAAFVILGIVYIKTKHSKQFLKE